MNIPVAQVSYRRRIGRSGKNPVFGIGTVGGLHLVVAARDNGGFTTLGAGSHPGIARFIAKRADDAIEFDLMKSEHLDPKFFEDLLPDYEELTAQIRAAEAGR